MGCKPILGDGKLILRLCQARIHLQHLTSKNRLLQLVPLGDPLCFLQGLNRHALRIYGNLSRDDLEIGRTDFVGNLLALRPDVFASDVAPDFRCVDAKVDLV